ncbi:MAG: sulfate ABC transporter permease subunit CysW [Fibrobacterota bacterium]|nr:sulfate ABC transporter permease subunit CysW [Chitinispirillaceae bacterium]
MYISNSIKSGGNRSSSMIFIGLTYFFVVIIFELPLLLVTQMAFEKGFQEYLLNIIENDTLLSINLTIVTTLIATGFNTVFGIAAAWLITKFSFKGRNILLTIIDIPFSVSPVVSGLMFVLLFGANGWFGEILSASNIKVIFAVPGIIIATTFITLPFVVRELLPVMETIGKEYEEAAVCLGANGWNLLFKVTLPSIKWGLMYGVIICGARAMGEFGAVSVVSGHIRGITTTVPLQVEMLYNEYRFTAAFSLASLLMCIAIITIVIKTIIEEKKEKSNSINKKGKDNDKD